MKKLLKTSVAVAMFFTTLTTFANTTDFSLKVIKEEGKTISFVLNDAKSVSLELKNDEGVVVYSENMKGNSDDVVNRTYDLSYLPKGIYFLEAETATKVITHKITVENNITMAEEALSEVYKPVMYTRGDQAMLQILDINETPVTVEILDAENNLLYEQTYNGSIDFSKKYELKKDMSEDYTFIIKYDNKSFIKKISL
ncbi:Por secretion system C-terminal sorting domain-containing protein [Pustulibacterium marinum]|uniref:Por secretion system C-terminal sorting domain-containing protein n=1 Tax=Pustulibacterium marinum TaxID=1224947 RepID=A0A1I7I0J9_9FLAO|nr:hypothetical protein [Pustulibacterium marinum]SFU66482.1 Por secretion system C-terminal sorting domain-containing protein [Pustulibacterium marinum]